jgi:hypothetical protein
MLEASTVLTFLLGLLELIVFGFVELLSPACSGLGLGSRILTLFDCHPVGCCYFPINVKNRDLG